MDAVEPTAPDDQHPDRVLLAAYRDHRDEDAFRRLLLRHEGWVRHLCRQTLRDEDLADDACQAVFVLLSRRAADIRDGACLAAWLQQVAHGIACNLIDARRRSRRHEQQAARAAMDQLQAERDAPEDEQMVAAQAFLPECLAELRPIDREVVIRHYLRCQEQAEIAEELGLSVAAVQKRATRAIDRLRALMHRRGVILAPALLMAMVSQARAAPPEELLTATMRSIRAGDALTGRVAQLADRVSETKGEWPRLLTKVVLVPCLVAVVAVLTVQSWRSNESSGADQMVVKAGPDVEWSRGDGRREKAVPGTELLGGDRLHTSVGNDLVVKAANGEWTLRPGGRAVVREEGLALTSGAAEIKGAQVDVVTARMNLGVNGRAWVMSIQGFDRVDVVDGEVVLDDGLTLSAGQALVRGPGINAMPQPRALRELAPEYGGLFFRDMAEVYARGERYLQRGPGETTERLRLDGEAIRRAAIDGELTLREGSRSRTVVRNPSVTATSSCLVVAPPGNRGRVHVMRTKARFSGRGSIGDGAEVKPLKDYPWFVEGWMPTGAPLRTIPPVNRDPMMEMAHASVEVGVAPDGMPIWEKTMANGEDGQWIFPSLMAGPAPVGWIMALGPEARAEIESVVFYYGLGTLRE